MICDADIRMGPVTVLTAWEADRLSSALPEDWTHKTLRALAGGVSVDPAHAHMLFDIHMRDALDEVWVEPRDAPGMHPPEYDYIDLAVRRIQAAHPGLIDEMLGRTASKAEADR